MGDEVVDREDFIDQVVTRLLHRNSVILAAPRRLGKTSVAHAILDRLKDREEAYTATVDLSGLSSTRELAGRLISACLANDPVLRVSSTIREGLGALLRLPQIQAKFQELELSLGLRAETSERSIETVLDSALDLPDRMAQKDGKLFVLLFDEFQTVTGLDEGSRLLSRMRSHFQLQKNTAFLFLGSQAGMMARLFGASNQPFFRFATLLSLPPVPPTAWRTYIRDRLGDHGIRIEDAALDVILEFTGGHPSDTMAVAFEAYLAARRKRVIDAAMAMLACSTAQDHVVQIFEAEIQALGAKARAVLGRVAKHEPLYEGERSRATVNAAIRDLVQAGVIQKLGRGRYEISEPMLEKHLLRPPLTEWV